MRIVVVGALFVAALASAQAQTSATANTKAVDASLVERALRPAVRLTDRPDSGYDIHERMRFYHVPGVSIAIVDDFRVVFARGYGVTELGAPTPVDTATLFLAGSISKPVFATGALRLVEQKKLSLDEDVNRSLKSWRFPESRFSEREKVTLRRLLTHSAGLTVWGFPGYAVGTPVPTVQQVLDGQPPANTAAVRNDTTPGARWLYSGGGITIAQLMAADATGESFPALMQRLVLAPAGMARSTYENPLPREREREVASGHEKLDTPVPGRFHIYPEMAAAGLWTTASDLARWAIALSRSYNGDSRGVLSPAMARQMISKQIKLQPPNGDGYWGLGVAVGGDGDSIQFSHGGRDEGFVASVRMWPKLGRGIVVLTNGVSGALIEEIGRGWAELYGMPWSPRKNGAPIGVDPVDVAPLAGRYVLVQQRDTVNYDVTFDAHGQLTLYSSALRRPVPLWPQAGGQFVDANSGAVFSFERSSTGGPARALVLEGANRRVAQRM